MQYTSTGYNTNADNPNSNKYYSVWWSQVTNRTGFSNATAEPHLEAIVIDGLSMKVYQDGELKGSATLPCLVTDCTGDTLELGREGDGIA